MQNTTDDFYTLWSSALLIFGGLCIALFHMMLTNVYIGHPALYDETYHMLAAASWNENKSFAILDGEYDRAWIFSVIVAKLTDLFGDTLESARWASVLPAGLLVFITTVFVGRKADIASGVVAGSALAISPALVTNAYIARFYALHALVVLLVAILVFQMSSHRTAGFKLFSFLAIVAALSWFGFHLQNLNAIALIAIASAAITLIFGDILSAWRRISPAWKICIAIGLVGIAILSGLIVNFEKYIAAYTVPIGWAEGGKDSTFFYLGLVRDWFPAAWPLFIVLSIGSYLCRPKLTVFCFVCFSVSFLVLSFAATKAGRYLLFAMPFFVIPVSVGAVYIMRYLNEAMTQRIKNAIKKPEMRRWAPLFSSLLILASILLYVRSDPSAIGAVKGLLHREYQEIHYPYGHYPDWETSKKEFRLLSQSYPFIISSTGVKAAYFLGNYDLDLNASVVRETDTGQDYGLDQRTGRRVISTPEALYSVIQSCSPGMAIIESHHLRSPSTMHAGIREVFNSHARQIEWQDDRFSVWVWDHVALKTSIMELVCP